MRAASVKGKIAKRIARTRRDVFLRADFADLGSYDQIGRGLAGLSAQGVLIRIGQGLYARAAPSPFDDRPVPTKGVSELVTEALARCGIQTRTDTHATRLQRGPNRASAERSCNRS
jgi:hypothetical protein